MNPPADVRSGPAVTENPAATKWGIGDLEARPWRGWRRGIRMVWSWVLGATLSMNGLSSLWL